MIETILVVVVCYGKLVPSDVFPMHSKRFGSYRLVENHCYVFRKGSFSLV